MDEKEQSDKILWEENVGLTTWETKDVIQGSDALVNLGDLMKEYTMF